MKRAWSFVSAEQMRSYALEARELVAFAQVHKITPFGAALAGVAFIRNALATMGGDASWWCKLITSTKENPLEEFRIDSDDATDTL